MFARFFEITQLSIFKFNLIIKISICFDIL